MPRFLLLLLGAGALIAVACSSFSSAEAPPASDAGTESGTSSTVDDAGAPPEAAEHCETVTFDLGASTAGAGWTSTVIGPNGHLEPFDGGVRASTDPNFYGSAAALLYRVYHRETLSRVTLTASLANATPANDWPAAGFAAGDGDAPPGASVQVQRTPMHIAVALSYSGDGGAPSTVERAPVGSFPDGSPFDLVLTANGAWSDGPTVSLVSNAYAADDAGPKLPAFPAREDAGAHVLDVSVGVLYGPPEGVSIEVRGAKIEVCRR